MIEKIVENILNALEKGHDKNLNQLENYLYKFLPASYDDFILVCDALVKSKQTRPYLLMTRWIKKREVYDLKYFPYYENWLYNYTTTWGDCDVFSYRVLNPMVEKYDELFEKVLKWAKSDLIYVKRASAVCLLHSSQSFVIHTSFNHVREIADILLDDKEVHVQKGLGWLLKYSYLSYPKETADYLKAHVKEMNQTTFHYALEKMNPSLKSKLMNL